MEVMLHEMAIVVENEISVVSPQFMQFNEPTKHFFFLKIYVLFYSLKGPTVRC